MERATRRLHRLYNFSLDADDNIKYERRTRKKKFKNKPKRTMKYGIQVPRNVKEAILLDEKNGNSYWQDAIKTEMDALIEMDCFQFREKGFDDPSYDFRCQARSTS